MAPHYVGFTTFLWGDTQYCAVCWLCRYSRGGDGGFYRNNCHTLWACFSHVMCVGCDCKTLFLYVEITGRIKRQKAAGWLKNTAFKVRRCLARVSAVRSDFLLTVCFKGSSLFHSLSSRRAMTGPQTFCTHASCTLSDKQSTCLLPVSPLPQRCRLQMLDGLRRRHASKPSSRPLSLNFSTFSAPPPSPDLESSREHPIRRWDSVTPEVNCHNILDSAWNIDE